MVEQLLNVPYHQQDAENFCGAACLQMVLGTIGIPINMMLQPNLYNEAHAHSVSDPTERWDAGPDGILYTIKDLNPQADQFHFVLYEAISQEIISKLIVQTIKFFRVAPIAMVWDNQHWVVVTGYRVTNEPVGRGDTAYNIFGFYLHNPQPVTPVSPRRIPPPPHDNNDGCGTGAGRGTPNEYIEYNVWLSDWMTGVRAGYWQGKFLAVCDPQPLPEETGTKVPVKKFFSGEKIIDKKAAGEYAMYGLKEQGLLDEVRLKNVLHNIHPGEDAVLVHRLDRSDELYYIVPMLSGEKKAMHALVCVDAKFGSFRQAAFAQEKQVMHFKTLSRKEILEALGETLEIKEEKARLIIHPELVSIYPALVWQPCKESLSPYLPFHMVTIQNFRIFIRLDKVVFPRLNTNNWGI